MTKIDLATVLVLLTSKYKTKKSDTTRKNRVLNSALSNRASWTSIEGETRASSQSRLVDTTDRSAVHVASESVQAVEQRLERGVGQAGDERDFHLGKFAREAQRALGGLFGGVGAVGEGRGVDLVEGVHCAVVAAQLEDLGNRLGEVEDIGLDCERVIYDGVLVSRVSLVEVVGETLVARLPVEVLLIIAVDGHEALQDVLVEDTLRVLRGLVGHEAVDEGEGRLGDLDTGEGKGEVSLTRVVWVLLDGLVVALLTEVAQDLQVVVGCSSVGLTVVQAVELVLDELLVGTVLVQVRLQRRAIGLVVVVRATDADVGAAVDRPSQQVAVDESAVEGEETTEIFGHSEAGVGRIDKLLDGGVSVVGEVVVVRQGVQTGTLATSVTWTWRNELVLALVADVLSLCVEGRRNRWQSTCTLRGRQPSAARDCYSGESLHLRGNTEGAICIRSLDVGSSIDTLSFETPSLADSRHSSPDRGSTTILLVTVCDRQRRCSGGEVSAALENGYADGKRRMVCKPQSPYPLIMILLLVSRESGSHPPSRLL
ncbi:Cloroperoxidase [Hortaea werneckii]|nr:Cloroperoxidase [Hortaea werneckii]